MIEITNSAINRRRFTLRRKGWILERVEVLLLLVIL